MNITDKQIDAAMIEMANIHPPLKREDCRRLIIAALSPHPHPVETARADVQPVAWRSRETDEDPWYYYHRNPLYYQMHHGHETEPIYSQATVATLNKQIDELKIQVCAPREQREFDLARAADKETFDAALAALVAERDEARRTLAECQREKEGVREVATNLFHSLPDILDEAAFGGNYSKLCDFTDAVHAMETALKSEGA